MLNTLEPSAFPIAIPLFPLRADTTLVANSGREVPPATIVKPITASDTPRFVATAVAPSTNKLLPPIKQSNPTRIHTTDNQVAIGFFPSPSIASSASAPCFLAPLSVIYIKIRNITKRIPASSLLISPSRHIINNKADATSAKGISFLTVVSIIVIGATNADTPTMSKALKMLEPTILPTAKSDVPFNAEIKLTQNSGILVPIATIVNPITICGIFIFSATATAPSVKRSAPHKTRAIPTTINKIFNNINS